jgi:hypothetical protein
VGKVHGELDDGNGHPGIGVRTGRENLRDPHG